MHRNQQGELSTPVLIDALKIAVQSGFDFPFA